VKTEASLLAVIAGVATKVKTRAVRLGIGDDGAVLHLPAGRELVVSTDTLVEGAHFLAGIHPPSAVGYKALARALSDLAAMGARPLACLASLVLPQSLGQRWLRAWLEGFGRAAARWKAPLVGGDLARGAQFSCDVVVLGQARRKDLLTRSGARPGDQIVVSGELGGSALGLERKQGAAWKRHLYPEPRLQLGASLRQRLGATAAIDISDGFILDLHRLCLASGVAAELERDVPLFAGASLEQGLYGGEDYELLFTVPAHVRVPPHCAGVALTRLGVIQPGRPGEVRFRGKRIPIRGWDHFSATLRGA